MIKLIRQEKRRSADLEDVVADILVTVQSGQLVLARQVLQGLGHVDDEVDRFHLGSDEVLGVRRRVVFDDDLAVGRVDNEFALDRQAGHDLGLDGGACADPPHVHSHLTEHLHVHAATSPSHIVHVLSSRVSFASDGAGEVHFKSI